jgi:hypothetical protein
MRIVTDSRKLNFFETYMSPITYSKDLGIKMIRSMEGFTFVKALDLNMGYYHQLGCWLCKIAFSWQKINIITNTIGYP